MNRCTLIALAATLASSVAAAERLAYSFTPSPGTGRLHVELLWHTGDRTSSTLTIQPHWASVRDVPALFASVETTPPAASRERTRWTFEHAPYAKIAWSADVICQTGVVDWPQSYHPILTADYFHGIGETFLPAPDGGPFGSTPYDVTLRWNLPDRWLHAVCSLGQGAELSGRHDVHTLRQSVFLVGNVALRSQAVQGSLLTVAICDGFEFNVDEFAELVARIIAAERRFVRDDAFPPYVVTAVPIGPPAKAGTLSMSGTGLHHSFATFLAPGAQRGDNLEHLLAHELFHHWNGRIIEREAPEEHLYWFSEGFTEYYALRILLESGIWDAATFCKWLNEQLAGYARNPARNATNGDIEQGFWSQRQTVGEAPYQRGVLLGLRWHARARQHGVSDGVDDLFRVLLHHARGGTKISNERIRAAGVERLGDWFGDEFERYVMRAETIDVPADALGAAFRGEVQTLHCFEPGFDTQRSIEAQRISGLVGGSAAEKAGLREGDELVGYSVYHDADREAELTVRRNGELHTIRYLPRGAAVAALQFRPRE